MEMFAIFCIGILIAITFYAICRVLKRKKCAAHHTVTIGNGGCRKHPLCFTTNHSSMNHQHQKEKQNQQTVIWIPGQPIGTIPMGILNKSDEELVISTQRLQHQQNGPVQPKTGPQNQSPPPDYQEVTAGHQFQNVDLGEKM